VIATVMEAYFNAELFRHPVAIVDLQATETGYAFSLTFQEKTAQLPSADTRSNGRDVRGRFARNVRDTSEHKE